MNYRNVHGNDISCLGFGCMRFPVKGEKEDEEKIEEMLYTAIEKGINYFDSAYVYHGERAETILGRLLNKEAKSKVKIATKQPTWMIESKGDMDKYLEIQLKRLKVDRIDFYLLHALFGDRWRHIMQFDVLNWAENKKKEGLIKYFGFSYHDNTEKFKEIIDSYNWDLCQIQYNYTFENKQAGTKGYEYACGKGIPVIIMEPLQGGMLANPNDIVNVEWNKEKLNPVETSFKWLWNKKGISCVLSGMSSLEQIIQNSEFASKGNYNILSEKEIKTIEKVNDLYKDLNAIPCTKCNYCMPCPKGVDIPKNFEYYNDYIVYDNKNLEKMKGISKNDSGKVMYSYHMDEGTRAKDCINCKVCEEKCPQGVKISEWMPKVHSALNMEF